ncbi:hypothetical protein HYH03_015808 [Edaphochlamys debaryana]|uniref:Protein arginine methyltransferase NDUFAF7 n=1 Tax=Edaphochlamys debaryana TaxID=47281 RepID=A0A836BQV1_9CHLO|nr:hypothetical protein HYH03_015808 [Edaphochlamys debaryana]|eukprot:KAG2485427.1 hypothetical protein HYH03_015808 [Edaphochlamys debaryana]
MVRGGPISLAEYMQDCLTSPQGGFYMSRDVFGSAGDFVTSPEISQMFGEMVGIWCVHTWMQLGQPPRLRLVELGPGRGTLMADLLRGTAGFKDFSRSLSVHLVEMSPALRAMQWRALRCSEAASSHSPSAKEAEELRHLRAGLPPLLGQAARRGAGAGTEAGLEAGTGSGGGLGASAGAEPWSTPEEGVSGFNGCSVRWHTTLDSVPAGPGPSLYIAHEFFDALPVHQFVRHPTRGWTEKMVDLEDRDEGPQGGGSGSGSESGPRDGSGGTTARLAVGPGDSPDLKSAAEQGGGGSGSSSGSDGDAGSTKPHPTAAATGSDGSGSSPRSASESGSGSGAEGAGVPAHTTSGSGLRLVLSPGPTPAASMLVPRRLAGLAKEEAEAIQAVEICAAGMATAERLSQRIAAHGGAALVMDYGRGGAPYADSLVAIRAHRGVGILDGPGTADLSAWVDFDALRLAAEGPPGPGAAGPVRASGPVSQAAFLRALGIEHRLQALAAAASSPEQARSLEEGVARLVGEGEGSMGRSYQVMAIHESGLSGKLAGL